MGDSDCLKKLIKDIGVDKENIKGFAEAMASASVVVDKMNESVAAIAKAANDAIEDVFARSCPVCNNELVVIKEGKINGRFKRGGSLKY